VRGALAKLARGDGQQLLDAHQRRIEGGRILVVALADHHALRREVRGVRGRAYDGDEVLRRDPLLQQGEDGETAKVTRGSGDSDHKMLLRASCVVECAQPKPSLTLRKYLPRGK